MTVSTWQRGERDNGKKPETAVVFLLPCLSLSPPLLLPVAFSSPQFFAPRGLLRVMTFLQAVMKSLQRDRSQPTAGLWSAFTLNFEPGQTNLIYQQVVIKQYMLKSFFGTIEARCKQHWKCHCYQRKWRIKKISCRKLPDYYFITSYFLWLKQREKYWDCIPRVETFCTDDISAMAKRQLGDELWKVDRVHPLSLFSSTLLHIITTDPDNTAAYNYTINASAAISTMF